MNEHLDAHPIIVGVISAALYVVASAFRSLRTYLPTEDAYSIAALQICGVLSGAGAAAVFYAALVRANVHFIIAAIAAMLLTLAPQMGSILTMRQDWPNLLAFCVILYCGVVIAKGEERPKHAVTLGLALAVAATLKINGVMFAALPVLAVLARGRDAWKRRQPLMKFAALTFAVGMAAYLLLMARYLYHYPLIDLVLKLYPAGIANVTSWREIYGWGFTFLYYNFEILQHHGMTFIALYLASAAALLLLMLHKPEPAGTYFVLAFVAFSVFSTVSMQFSRGGYHLLPLFIAPIAYMASRLWHARRFAPLRYAALMGIFVATVVSFRAAWWFYNYQMSVVRDSTEVHVKVWRPAHQWLRANLKKDDRLCAELHSNWVLPVGDYLTQIKWGPFEHPYTTAAKIAQYEPPDDQTVLAQCDVLILGDYHRAGLGDRRRQASKEIAARWDDFFERLSTRPHLRFGVDHERQLLQTRWIEIYPLR